MTVDRQSWMSTLAKSRQDELESALAQIGTLPPYTVLIGPELGSVMIRARAGGTGTLFNLGEMTVARATVELQGADGQTVLGHGYVAGRSRRQAELAAFCDALLQTREWHERIALSVLEPLRARADERRSARARYAQPTKVEFFTVVRSGENT